MAKNFFKDLTKASFKQWLKVSSPFLLIGIPGFVIFGTLSNWYPYSNWFFWLFWSFLAIALFPMIRNLIGGAIPNIFKDWKENRAMRKKNKK